MFGENIQASNYFPRIIFEEAVKRLQNLIQQGNIHSGGFVDIQDKYVEPTVIDNVKPEYDVMQEEILVLSYP